MYYEDTHFSLQDAISNDPLTAAAAAAFAEAYNQNDGFHSGFFDFSLASAKVADAVATYIFETNGETPPIDTSTPTAIKFGPYHSVEDFTILVQSEAGDFHVWASVLEQAISEGSTADIRSHALDMTTIEEPFDIDKHHGTTGIVVLSAGQIALAGYEPHYPVWSMVPVAQQNAQTGSVEYLPQQEGLASYYPEPSSLEDMRSQMDEMFHYISQDSMSLTIELAFSTVWQGEEWGLAYDTETQSIYETQEGGYTTFIARIIDQLPESAYELEDPYEQDQQVMLQGYRNLFGEGLPNLANEELKQKLGIDEYGGTTSEARQEILLDVVLKLENPAVDPYVAVEILEAYEANIYGPENAEYDGVVRGTDSSYFSDLMIMKGAGYTYDSGDGDDHFVLQEGFESGVIDQSGADLDILHLSGNVLPEDLNLSWEGGDDLIIDNLDAGWSLTVEGQFDYSEYGPSIDEIHFSNGMVWDTYAIKFVTSGPPADVVDIALNTNMDEAIRIDIQDLVGLDDMEMYSFQYDDLQYFEATNGSFLFETHWGSYEDEYGPYTNAVYFQPDAGFEGVASFTYSFLDEIGRRITETVEVGVGVEVEAPRAQTITLEAEAGTPFEFSLADLEAFMPGVDLNNQFLPEIEKISPEGQFDPGWNYYAGEMSLEVEAGFSGDILFEYTYFDENQYHQGDLIISYAYANQPPVLVEDIISGGDAETVDILAGQLFGNDSDPEGDFLSIKEIVSHSSGIEVVLTEDGGLSINRTGENAQAGGEYIVTYLATDGSSDVEGRLTLTLDPTVEPASVNELSAGHWEVVNTTLTGVEATENGDLVLVFDDGNGRATLDGYGWGDIDQITLESRTNGESVNLGSLAGLLPELDTPLYFTSNSHNDGVAGQYKTDVETWNTDQRDWFGIEGTVYEHMQLHADSDGQYSLAALTGFDGKLDLDELTNFIRVNLMDPDRDHPIYPDDIAIKVNNENTVQITFSAIEGLHVGYLKIRGEAVREALEEINGPELPESFGITISDIRATWEDDQGAQFIGDVNGDGFTDAWIHGDYREELVLLGSADGWSTDHSARDLDAANSFVFHDERSLSGSITGIGDINNDGIDDMLFHDQSITLNGDNYTGAAFVLFGRNTGFDPRLDIANLDETDGFALEGQAFFDQFGIAATGLGDVNGDGIDDFAISAPSADTSSTVHVGKAYVFFGSEEGFGSQFDLTSLNGSNGFVLAGTEYLDASGETISDAGDVNGDGINDILIGAPYTEVNSTSGNHGQAYVAYGSADGFAPEIILGELDGTNGFALQGDERGAWTGYAVSSAGDFNGDGLGDILVGAPAFSEDGQDTDDGQAYLIYGKEGGLDTTLSPSQMDASDGIIFDLPEEGRFLGGAVASAGDVNGDGFDDILIGAPGSDEATNDAPGKAYLVFGSEGGFDLNLDLSTLDGEQGFVFHDTSSIGFSFDGGEDVNGDGFDDFLIGTMSQSSSESHLVYGGENMLELFDLADGEQDGQINLRFIDEAPADYLFT